MPEHGSKAAGAELLHPRGKVSEKGPPALPLARRKRRDIASQGRRIRKPRAAREPFANARGTNASGNDADRNLETFGDGIAKGRDKTAAVSTRAGLGIVGECPPGSRKSCDQAGLRLLFLFAVIARLRGDGVGIIYISHRLEEIAAIADRITVLRDGETVATRDAHDLTRADLIRMMVGRELDAVFPKRQVPPGEVALALRQLSNRRTGVRDVSLSVRRGEIVGIAGLVGSGRTQLAETIFGLTPADGGEILLGGTPVRITSPADAIRLGIGYVPEDRRQHGVVLEMSVVANISVASLPAVSRFGLIDRAAEDAVAARYADQFRIKVSSVAAEVGSLSGGNQQKVALARWLSTNPSVLILDEPTQGVDVGSKAEIHGLMQDLVERGMAILMISSELPEILGLSDRILVMREGRICGEFARANATEEIILNCALRDAA